VFNSTGPHYCPNGCVAFIGRKGPVLIRLECIVSNYSGCGVDITYCEKCGKKFQISYKVEVDKIIPIGISINDL